MAQAIKYAGIIGIEGEAGQGIGLELSRRIVLHHQGSITFQTAPGRTAFIVWLPSAAEEPVRSGEQER